MGVESDWNSRQAASSGSVGYLVQSTTAMESELERKRREELVQENLAWLRGWLSGHVRNPDVVDDLCQESFLRALRRLPGLRNPDRFSAWLYRIAENALRDHIRSEARRRKRILSTDRLDELESAGEARDPEETEEVERLLEAIRNLPPRLREPLLLRHSNDLTYREIGKILGIRENTVQVRIFRARKLLQKKLGAQK